MATIGDSLQAIRARIAQAARDAGRAPSEVTLLAVSKGQPAARIAEAAAAGQRAFGESYAQEALAKIDALRASGLHDVHWHFVGPLQSNKTRPIAERFDWVQSVDRLRTAERLSMQRPASLAPLNVLIQVNISGEASKSGVAPGEAGVLAGAVARLPGLRLRGLMAIPEPDAATGAARARFRALRELFARLRAALGGAQADFDTLSMGMSDDYVPAIAEGATMVRIGTAIFGLRADARGSATSPA